MAIMDITDIEPLLMAVYELLQESGIFVFALQNEEELAPLLSEKAKEVLEKLRDNQSELNYLNECEVFVCGFRLGARIMLEVLDGSDKWGEFEE